MCPNPRPRPALNEFVTAGLWIAFAVLLAAPVGLAVAAAPRLDAPYVSYRVGGGAQAVAIGNFDGIGPPDLAVVNRSDNTVSVLLARGGGAYAEKVDYPVGSIGPTAIATGDFNGDLRADFVTANQSTSNVSVMIASSTGTFGAAVKYTTGGSPRSVAVGDVNGDGRLDLVVANRASNSVSVLFGTGGGTFLPKTDYATGSAPNCVALGLFNGDAALDIVTANTTANTVSILLNTGSGSFNAKTDFPSGGSAPQWVAVGDYSGDGNADLVVANQSTSPSTSGVGILIGNGAGTFFDVLGTPYNVDGYPSAVALGDLDSDGRVDLVAACAPSNIVAVRFRQSPAPPYFDAVPLPATYDFGAGTSPTAPALADLNGDGRLDIAVVNQDRRTVTILFNHPPAGPGGVTWFEGGRTLPLDGLAGGCAIGQLDGTGPADIAVAMGFGTSPTDYVKTINMNSDGSFGTEHSTETAPGAYSIAIGQFNGSAPLDMAVSTVNGTAPGHISFLPGSGGGTFGPRTDITVPNDCWSVANADLNGDGFQDLAGTMGDNVMILLGNGNGTFQAPVYYSAGGTVPDGLAIAQLNGVGGLDIAVVNLLSGTLCVLPGNGNGTFGAPSAPYSVGLSPEWVAVGDFNEDGRADLVAADDGTQAVYVLINNGVGGFNAPVLYPTQAAPFWIAVGDMDGDGHQDLVTANPANPSLGSDGCIAVFPGRGNGTFGLEVVFGLSRYDSSISGFPGGYSVAVGDLNSDGRLDLAAPVYATPGRLEVLLGLGPTVSAVEEDAPKAPVARLSVRPNPARGSTMFATYVPHPSRARLEIYDVSGRLVGTPIDKEVPTGPLQVGWNGIAANGSPLPSSVYVARLSVAGKELRTKFVWVK